MHKAPFYRFASKLTPAPLFEALSMFRRHRRSVRLDARFKADLERYTIDPVLIRNVELVADRFELLRRVPQGGIMAEVGVARGRFTRHILDICKPTKLYLIDLWSEDSARYANLVAEAEDAVRRELDDGVAEIRRGYSWDVIAALPDGALDFIYIDAAHDYESVKKDLAAALPKMAPGAIIAGHDYTRWSSNGLHRWGVVEAVNEFANSNRWELRLLSNEPGRHLSYALKRLGE